LFFEKCSYEGFPDQLLSNLKLWFACLSEALTYIHSQKIRHKDIKPGNILIRADLIYFTDFGLATDFHSEITSSSEGSIWGKTPMYSPPEVISEGKHSCSADIFSLGCIFAEMATLLDKRSTKDFFNYRVRDSKSAYHATLDNVSGWLKTSTSFNNFIEQMLSTQPEKRSPAMRVRDIVSLGGVDGVSKLRCQHRVADLVGCKVILDSKLSQEHLSLSEKWVSEPGTSFELSNRSAQYLYGIKLY
jgi:serine/threonine protein kinase